MSNNDEIENNLSTTTKESDWVSGITTNTESQLTNVLSSNINTTSMAQENWFHSPAQQEVRKHLDWNVERIFLDDLKKKEVYMKYSICVDGREDGEWVASFGGFAGILGATLPALKEIFWEKANAHNIIQSRLGENKFYVHCDDHTQHDTHGEQYYNCKKIGCGAINLMLKPENGDKYGYANEDREFFWNLIDSNASVKVLKWEHEEQGIISIENKVRNDKETSAAYINVTKGNIKDWVQYFVNHVTWRNLIIDYFAEDLANHIIATYPTLNEWFDEGDLMYTLKEAIMKWSNAHAWSTISLLWAAQKVINEKWSDAVIEIEKISNKWNHRVKAIV